jgi:hypothetical protein
MGGDEVGGMFCPNDDCPDFVKTGLRSEYREDITVCPYCGAAMVAERPDDPELELDGIISKPPVAPDEEMEPVVESVDLTEIAVIKSILDGAGIPYLALGEERFSAFRGAFLAGSIFSHRSRGVIFTVPARMADEAHRLLEELVDDTDDTDQV